MKLSVVEEDVVDDGRGAANAMRSQLVNSLSYSYPGTTLSQALANMEPTDSDTDPLSSSCFAELRLEKCKLEEIEEDMEPDDELTSLTWLQDTDLLKNIKTGDRSICTSPPPEEQHKENTGAHPPHVPYNPQKHVNSKPPYSFSCLIFMAVEDCPEKKLPVKDIYNWILTHFPYFQNAPTGWKNSVRHNLSLNKCFKKVDKEKGSSIGKGSLWMIDPDYRPNLLQALRKTPYHPYHQLQMFNNSPPTTNILLPGRPCSVPYTARINVNSPSPHLFPFLSRRLAQSNGVGSTGTPGGLETDIDVANTLVSLKRAAESRRPLKCRNGETNGARSRSPSPPEFGSEQEKEILKLKHIRAQREANLCTSVPSEDHTYSLTRAILASRAAGATSPASSIDDAYEFGNNMDRSTSDADNDMYSEPSDFDEDDVSDEETEAVYRAAIERIKADAAAATAAVPNITKRIMMSIIDISEEERKLQDSADALLNLAAIATAAPPLLTTQIVRKDSGVEVHPISGSNQQRRPASPEQVSPNTMNNNNNIDAAKLMQHQQQQQQQHQKEAMEATTNTNTNQVEEAMDES